MVGLKTKKRTRSLAFTRSILFLILHNSSIDNNNNDDDDDDDIIIIIKNKALDIEFQAI